MVGLTLPYLESGTHLELWGACVSAVRPTDSYLTYEALVGREDVVSVREPMNKNRSAPWSVRIFSDNEAYYFGPYVDPMRTLSRLRVFVNVTSASFSAGTEYTTLEAVNAGCLPLVSQQMVDVGSHLQYESFMNVDPPTVPKRAAREEALLKALAFKISKTLQYNDAVHTALAAHNRDTIRTEHDPATVASAALLQLL